MSTSKTGKHGHAKVHLVAIDVRLFRSIRSDKHLLSGLLIRYSLAKNWLGAWSIQSPAAFTESCPAQLTGRYLSFYSQHGRA